MHITFNTFWELNKNIHIIVIVPEAYKEWHDKMGTEEGERMIYKVAKKGKIKKRYWGSECDSTKQGIC